MIRRAIAAAVLATLAGALAAPAFAEDDRSQVCIGLHKKDGGYDNICVDVGAQLPG